MTDGEAHVDQLGELINGPYILLTYPVDHEGKVHPKINAGGGLGWQDVKDRLFEAARVTQSSRPEWEN